MALENVKSVTVNDRLKAPFTDDTAADLSLHILGDNRQSDIGKDQIPDIFTEFAFFVDFDRRDTQSLLPDFGGVGVVTTLNRAADICLVAFAGGPAD